MTQVSEESKTLVNMIKGGKEGIVRRCPLTGGSFVKASGLLTGGRMRKSS